MYAKDLNLEAIDVELLEKHSLKLDDILETQKEVFIKYANNEIEILLNLINDDNYFDNKFGTGYNYMSDISKIKLNELTSQHIIDWVNKTDDIHTLNNKLRSFNDTIKEHKEKYLSLLNKYLSFKCETKHLSDLF